MDTRTVETMLEALGLPMGEQDRGRLLAKFGSGTEGGGLSGCGHAEIG
jgi:hypothetical protein